MSPSELISSVEELSDFVRGEFAVQRAEIAELQALPVEERIEQGRCWTGLEFEKIDDGFQLYRHGGNNSEFREGDFVCLSDDEPSPYGNAFIFREEEEKVWLSLRGEKDTQGTMLDQSVFDAESIFLAALDQLLQCENGRERILPLLNGSVEHECDPDLFDEVMRRVSASRSFEERQEEAIAACVSTRLFHLVQGPPGTGKTHVLSEVVRQLVERGEKVLITSFTHRAIDHALASAARVLQDDQRVARIRSLTFQRNRAFQRYNSFQESHLEGLSGGYVVGATPFALEKYLAGVDFDTVVFDEASQVLTPLAVMAMLRAKRYLFFGDEKQLGPVVVSRRQARNLSIFERLKHQDDTTMLNVTWRLNERLARWPGENFYHGELQSHPGICNRRFPLKIESDEKWIEAALDPEESLIWLPMKHEKCRSSSAEEADGVAAIVRCLKKNAFPLCNVAVVTPFRRQARRIRQLLAPRQKFRDCVVDTVERMQGQERDLILVSMAASNAGYLRFIADFFFNSGRLNVSVTRARSKVIIFASRSLAEFRFNNPDQDQEEEAALLRSLLREAKEVAFAE